MGGVKGILTYLHDEHRLTICQAAKLVKISHILETLYHMIICTYYVQLYIFPQKVQATCFIFSLSILAWITLNPNPSLKNIYISRNLAKTSLAIIHWT